MALKEDSVTPDHEALKKCERLAIFLGTEGDGLPDAVIEECDYTVRIPMKEEARSLNLSNSVAIVLYEALRQNGFAGLQGTGQLTGRKEEPGEGLDYV